jgi:hypothetical protein
MKKLEKYGIKIPEGAILTVNKIVYERSLARNIRAIHYKVPSLKHYSMTIELDPSTDELLFYAQEYRMPKQVKISLEEAKEKALEFIERVTGLPEDSKLTKAELLHRQEGGRLPDGSVLYDYWLYLFEWSRVINGIEVEGEVIRMTVDPSSGDVMSYFMLCGLLETFR